MKKFFVGALTAALLFTSSADAARYFTQGDAAGSSTPYGDNLSVGNYVTADDAKIYYEVYGEGKPVFVFHGGGVGTPMKWGK